MWLAVDVVVNSSAQWWWWWLLVVVTVGGERKEFAKDRTVVSFHKHPPVVRLVLDFVFVLFAPGWYAIWLGLWQRFVLSSELPRVAFESASGVI